MTETAPPFNAHLGTVPFLPVVYRGTMLTAGQRSAPRSAVCVTNGVDVVPTHQFLISPDALV
jgi:hypothetical protein